MLRHNAGAPTSISSLYWAEADDTACPPICPPFPLPVPEADVTQHGIAECDTPSVPSSVSVAADTFPVITSFLRHIKDVDVALEPGAASAPYIKPVLDELSRFMDFHTDGPGAAGVTMRSLVASSSATTRNKGLREDLLATKRMSESLRNCAENALSYHAELNTILERRAALLDRAEECLRLLTAIPGMPQLSESDEMAQ